MRNKRYFVFDFDNTLYNTENLKKDLRDLVVSSGLSSEDAQKIYDQAFKKEDKVCFSLHNFIDTLIDYGNNVGVKFDPTTASDLHEKIDSNTYVLPGAEELLLAAQEQSGKLILLTLGEKCWQQRKFYGSKLEKYFNEEDILYTDEIGSGKVKTLQKYLGDNSGNIIFFEDKPEEAGAILNGFSNSVAMMRYETSDSRYSNEDFDQMKNEYGDRFFWSDNLNDLKIIFLDYVRAK